jgi:hypothetical protein
MARRRRVFAAVVSAMTVLAFGTPAHASPLTLDFSGTVDLTDLGGLASNTFSGSVTWDPSQSPFLEGTGGGPGNPTDIAQYVMVSESLSVDGIDLTAHINPSTSTSGTLIQMQVPPLSALFGAFFAFSSTQNVNGAQFISFLAEIESPFTSLALPSDFTFVRSETFTLSDFAFPQTFGTLSATPLPEPATLTLTALGLGGVIRWSRRRRAFR